jgi:hypothetical protein
MMGSWRRSPPGKGHQALVTKRETHNAPKYRKDVARIEEAELVEEMRLAGASEKMIQRDLEWLRSIRAAAEVTADPVERVVDEGLTDYLNVEKRMKERRHEEA